MGCVMGSGEVSKIPECNIPSRIAPPSTLWKWPATLFVQPIAAQNGIVIVPGSGGTLTKSNCPLWLKGLVEPLITMKDELAKVQAMICCKMVIMHHNLIFCDLLIHKK